MKIFVKGWDVGYRAAMWQGCTVSSNVRITYSTENLFRTESSRERNVAAAAPRIWQSFNAGLIWASINVAKLAIDNYLSTTFNAWQLINVV